MAKRVNVSPAREGASKAASSPEREQYYRIKPKKFFEAYHNVFRPGQEYVVKAKIYDSDVDGTKFADLCESATPFET